VVSYFLRYFSSTSTEQISPIPPDLSPVSIRLALLFLLPPVILALRVTVGLSSSWGPISMNRMLPITGMRTGEYTQVEKRTNLQTDRSPANDL
jgi:hypothetical protein